MINKPPSKKDIRSSLENDVERFLSRGKEIDVVPRGVSSRDEAREPLKPSPWQMGQSSQERTYLPDVVQKLESRKAPEAKPAKSIKKKRARKRLIYDDFGEPLRWVWVEE